MVTKQLLKTFALAFAMTAVNIASFAQDANRSSNRPSHEQMVETQANNIAKQLGLDDKTTKKFLSVYKSEQEDMRQLMPRRGRGGMPPRGQRPPEGQQPEANGQDLKQGKPSGNLPKMSEEEQKKIASLKETYNKKYSKFLSQEQITQMYKLQEQERNKRHFGGKHQ